MVFEKIIIKTKSIINSEIYNFNFVKKYVMSPKFSVDIDDEIDFELCKILIKKNNNE